MSTAIDVTRLLGEWQTNGREDALSELLPAVYGELRALARRHLAAERPGHTLQPTALVHEVYLRLAAEPARGWVSRRQFFAVVGRLMRSLLIDHARARRTLKRDGNAAAARRFLDRLPTRRSTPSAEGLADLVALDEALAELAAVDERKCRTIQLRFLAGMTIDETAQALEVSTATVILDTRLARAWLHRALCRQVDDAV